MFYWMNDQISIVWYFGFKCFDNACETYLHHCCLFVAFRLLLLFCGVPNEISIQSNGLLWLLVCVGVGINNGGGLVFRYLSAKYWNVTRKRRTALWHACTVLQRRRPTTLYCCCTWSVCMVAGRITIINFPTTKLQKKIPTTNIYLVALQCWWA